LIFYLQKFAFCNPLFVSTRFVASFWPALLSALPVCFLRHELALDPKFTLCTAVVHIYSHVHKEMGTTEIQSYVCTVLSSDLDLQPFFLAMLADVLLFSNGPGGFDQAIVEKLLTAGPSSPASVVPYFRLFLSAAQ
jgi:hypothetical protein